MVGDSRLEKESEEGVMGDSRLERRVRRVDG